MKFRNICRIFGLVLILMFLCSCSKGEEESSIELEEPVSVAVLSTLVQYGDLFDASVIDGYVVPVTREILMENQGNVGRVMVFLGEHVEEGQVLLELDHEKAMKEAEALQRQLQYQIQANELANQQKELKLAAEKKELERLQYYGYAYTTIQRKEIEIEELELEISQQKELQSLQIQRLERENQEKQEEIQMKTITAPVSGTIVYLAPVGPGDRLKRLDTLFLIALDDQYQIETEFLPQSTFDQSDRVEVKIGAQTYQVEYQPMDSKEYISRKLAGKVVHSFYSFAEPVSQVKNGDYAALILYHHVKDHVLVIPSSSVYQDEGGRYVYVIQEDGSRVRRGVTIGTTTRIGYEVTGGLMEGERIYVKE